MKNKIFLRQANRPGIEVRVNVLSYGPNGHLMIANEDQTIWLSLSGHINELATDLERLANEARKLKVKR